MNRIDGGRPWPRALDLERAMRVEDLKDVLAANPGLEWSKIRPLVEGVRIVHGIAPHALPTSMLLLPKAGDMEEFDRRVCAAGLRDYLRERAHGPDPPALEIGESRTLIRVKQFACGTIKTYENTLTRYGPEP